MSIEADKTLFFGTDVPLARYTLDVGPRSPLVPALREASRGRSPQLPRNRMGRLAGTRRSQRYISTLEFWAFNNGGWVWKGRFLPWIPIPGVMCFGRGRAPLKQKAKTTVLGQAVSIGGAHSLGAQRPRRARGGPGRAVLHFKKEVTTPPQPLRDSLQRLEHLLF